MADDASPLREQPPARLRVARRVEIVEREEESDKIPCLSRVELGPGDPHLCHAPGHASRVVPHGRREIVKRARARGAAEIRANLSADPVDRMTLDAALRAEDARAGQRILRRAEERLSTPGAREQDEWSDNGRDHHPGACSPHTGA
jgi:hypothetical protein